MKVAHSVNPQRFVYIAGVCSLTFFLIVSLCWQNLFDAIYKAQIILDPRSTLYRIWVDNRVPIYLEIYLFNFTNAEEFKRNKTVVPKFEEIGPFLFEETRQKVDISWNKSQETVTFNQTRKWRLVPEASEDFSINVTNINPIAATIAYISRLWESKLQRAIANTLLNAHEPFFVTASAREWIFDGIPDSFLDIFEHLRNVTEIPIPYNRFGWFYDRNGSSSFDGAFTIQTGFSFVDELGEIVAWNYKNKTEHYVDECALVKGNTGEIIPPLKPFQQNLSVFASDICSYITLKYGGSTTFKGIYAYEYIGDRSVFDNGTSYPENLCFSIGESNPSGSRNVSSCRYNSPAFISFPNFYLADPYYSEKVAGMKPDESKHKFTFKIEPITGIPLAVDASFQINFLVEPYEWCDEFRDVPKVYVPMLWFKQSVKMTSEYSDVLKIVIFLKKKGGYITLAYTGLIMFCLSAFICWRRSTQHVKEDS